jgi:acyl carrier protein
MQTIDTITRIIGEQVDIHPAEIQPDQAIMRDLGADSLDVVQIMMAVEEEFGVDVPDDELESLVTVLDVVRKVEEKLPTPV